MTQNSSNSILIIVIVTVFMAIDLGIMFLITSWCLIILTPVSNYLLAHLNYRYCFVLLWGIRLVVIYSNLLLGPSWSTIFHIIVHVICCSEHHDQQFSILYMYCLYDKYFTTMHNFRKNATNTMCDNGCMVLASFSNVKGLSKYSS